jgi:ketosteroid isomerase-like protein
MQDVSLVAERLSTAINRHDVSALVGCFHPFFRSELPTLPDRGYRGTEQLRAYWQAVFEDSPDLQAEVLRATADMDTAWIEWCWHGSRADGTTFARAGVIICGVSDERIAWSRLYMEPVQGDPDTVAEWVLHDLSMARPAERGRFRRRR